MEPRRKEVHHPPSSELSSYLLLTYFALLAGCVVLCFFPLLFYFFAQDDFTLLFNASRNGARSFLDFFSYNPGLFRPLTKAGYFALAYKMFGLNAPVYHVVSLLVHFVNSVLVYLLLTRCRVGKPASLLAAGLFGLSVAFFHVIAWVACIQQLVGQFFLLAGLVKGIDHLRSGSKKARWISFGCYLLALASLEQAFALPLILVAFAVLDVGRPEARRSAGEVLRGLSWHLGAMAAYLLFMLVYKGTPQEGPYVLTVGKNAVENLLTYLAWTVHFWVSLPRQMNAGAGGFSGTHAVLAVLILYQLFKKRIKAVVFGLTYFLSTISPALFLTNHTFYLHTYVPAFGILYLLAAAAEDALSLRVVRSTGVRFGVLLVVLAGITTMSYVNVRKNEKLTLSDNGGYKQSFVLRRAEIARNVYDTIMKWKSPDEKVAKVYMVYAFEGGRDEAIWRNENVKAATGMGRLVNLIYHKPDMPVVFRDREERLDMSELDVTDVYFYDDLGNCRRLMKREGEGPGNRP